MPEPVTESSELDDILYEYTITHTGNSHNARCRCLGGTKSHLKYQLRELIARERQKAVFPPNAEIREINIPKFKLGSKEKTTVTLVVDEFAMNWFHNNYPYEALATQSNKGEAE